MTPLDLHHLADLLHRRSGLTIGADRARLIESKLAPVARRFGFKSCAAMLAELPYPQEELAEAITEAMTTNESSFFRDRPSFDLFEQLVLPALMTRRGPAKRLRIWSAACAAGQEAYSIAMLLDDHKLIAKGWTVDVIATDISAEMVARGEQGLYSHFEVQRGLPVRRLVDHFSQEGSNWRVGETLRRMVTFRPFNLLDSFGWLEDIDVVFCRNVLMYLDHKAKVGVLDQISEVLLPDGYLMLGSVETPQGLSNAFDPVSGSPGLYVPARAALPRAAAG